MEMEKVCRAFVRIREERAKLRKEYEAKDRDLLDQMELLRSVMLDHCKEHNVDSVRTGAGTFYRTLKKRYWTGDWENMHRFIVEHNVPELLDKRLNQTNVKQFLEEHPDVVPPGLNSELEFSVSVRKNK